MLLKLAYSPCPNDTFIFHAMVHGLIDCEGLTFETILTDVEELNRAAGQEQFHICKLSYHAYFYLHEKYRMLRTGSALGFHNGPLLVTPANSNLSLLKGKELAEKLSNCNIAIPGNMTTGALLLKIAFPEVNKTTPLIFSDIADAVVSGKYDAGVLIHEGRFTYRERGLRMVMDLGENWHDQTSLPIPLGGISILRSLNKDIQTRVERVLKRSILFAMENPEVSADYIASNAQELNRDVREKHIKLFVNKYSLDIGEEGERAIDELYQRFCSFAKY